MREGERCWEKVGQGGRRWDHGRLGGIRVGCEEGVRALVMKAIETMVSMKSEAT